MRAFLFLLFFTLSIQAELVGSKAPALKPDVWVNLPEGVQVDSDLLKDWKGKVVYLYFFQSWCPGCHSSGFPTLQTLQKKFKDDPAVRFAAVQTVFEGYHTNTKAAAQRMVDKYKLKDIPVGHSGSDGNVSPVMRSFETRGTPWTVIVDKSGKVQFEDFHIEPKAGEKLIKKLKNKY